MVWKVQSMVSPHCLLACDKTERHGRELVEQNSLLYGRWEGGMETEEERGWKRHALSKSLSQII